MNTTNLVNRLVLAWARWAPRATVALMLVVGCARPAELSIAQFAQSMPDERVDQIIVERLHRHCQPNGPVGIVREEGNVLNARAGMRVLAYTEECGPGWLIHLSNDIHGELRAAVLEHEWAHALTWGEELSHGPEWGVALSTAYRGGHLDLDTPPAIVLPVQPLPSETK